MIPGKLSAISRSCTVFALCCTAAACQTTQAVRDEPGAPETRCNTKSFAADLVIDTDKGTGGPGDATAVRCVSGSGCGASETDTPQVEQRDWVRWRFDPIEESPKFYVIFTNDESPGNSGKSRKPTISASRNGELCLKINGRARTNESYYYSVFVKHCKKTDDATCQPKVLDPIIYVR